MNRRPTGTPSTRSCRPESRSAVCARIALGLLLAGAPAFATEPGIRDPAFSKVPFDKWLSDGKSQIHWSVTIRPAQLSTHQRFILRVGIRVDGKDAYRRRGSGQLIALIQYRDASGVVWQNHSAIELSNLDPGVQNQYLDTTFYAFVLPGDYSVSLAVCDSTTLEHSITVRKVHVESLRTEPLPAAWEGLPSVDIVAPLVDPPDVWFLPDVSTHLNLRVATKRPVHIQVLLNTTPSQRSSGSLTAMRANMSLLIPALKILSTLNLPNGKLDTAFLDLTHRRVTFDQEDVHRLDWHAIQQVFAADRPGIIDASALQGQWKMRRFFWDEVTRRLEPRADGAVPVVIVLSGPAFLEDQEPFDSSRADGNSQQRLFYIRYRSQQPPLRRGPPSILRGTMMGRGGPRGVPSMPIDPDYLPPMKVDDLEQTVQPLNARIFDAASPQQFRRVLAAVLEQISRM